MCSETERDSDTRFFTIFVFKVSTLWTRKNSFANFFVFAKIFAKNMCCRSQQLRWHCVSVVNDYADTVSALPTTMLTPMKLFYFGKSKKLTKKLQKM